MRLTGHPVRTLGALLLLSAVVLAGDDLTFRDAKDRIRVRTSPVPAELRNDWPDAWEESFWDRANAAIRANGSATKFGNTYFENEKAMYPNAMFAYLGGQRAAALKALQEEDNQAGSWNSLTDGIDYFACFTLKGQMRKYFLFGPELDPAYRARMKSGARKWTEQDPLRRPNPYYKGQKDGWTPEAKNSWVDVRTTDNLQAMRETAVYLMAEETGNEEVRALYKDRIRTFVARLYQVGMGEWDSENYHAHTFTTYLNLYDFARDAEVRTLAKAAVDFFCATAAFKYSHGAMNGPSKRDYNHFTALEAAANVAWLYFDDTPAAPRTFDRDQVHLITSAYRPPAAVVELAHKNFARPVEVFAAHAPYEALRQGAGQPETYETTYIGHTFQLGTLAQGTHGGDVNGFKLVAQHGTRGADFFMANATSDPTKMGSAQYSDAQQGRMNVGQYRNLAILLNAPGDTPILFLAPKDVPVETAGGVTFFRYEQTWIALRPVNLQIEGLSAELTGKLKGGDLQVVRAKGTGGKVCGFALEVGEAETHGDYVAFRKAMLAKSRLDAGGAAEGRVSYVSTKGETLAVTYGEPLPAVVRNGKPHDWAQHTALYAPADGGAAPISLGWKTGSLRVEAGGKTFRCAVSADGKAAY
jgi:hypothetical protein